VELLPHCAAPLSALFALLKGECDGVSFVDTTILALCNNKHISRHQFFKGIAVRGKTSMGWFYGFKLHVIINSKGELISLKLTPGNVDDRRPRIMPGFWPTVRRQRQSEPRVRNPGQAGLQLITTLRKNMKVV
jgi:hypothetical protein